ncbi:MAG: magnesium/cobalt transporter CorA [Thermodesulfobacteriota bacterium]
MNIPRLASTTGLAFRLPKTSSQKAGLPPGTPVHIGEQKASEVRVTLVDYDQEHCEVVALPRPDVCALYQSKATVTWVNVDGLHQADLIEKICQCFHLHPLTIEDILNTTQRPKLDIFDDYLFLVIKTQGYNAATRLVDTEQISFVLGKGFLVTFQEKPGDTFEAVRARIQSNRGRIRKMGMDYLAYSLLDTIIDNYFTVLEQLGEEIEDLEEELIASPSQETLRRIHVLKREMILLRKSIWPLREVINGLMREEETSLISDAIHPFLKDLYDHTIQVIDTVETYRDILAGMLDIYLSSISNRMNEIMKVLTIFAAIFIPLTFITSLYGMNFNTAASPWNMPELNWFLGYPFALGLMVATAASMLFYFRRKKWF